MTASPTVAGDRNVVITAAEVNNSVIITGDGNTVHLHHSSDGALLEHDYRWNRPRPRESDDHPLAPPRFDRHVNRDDETRSLVGEGGTPRVVNVYGSSGVGKTYLLVEAINRPDVEMRDGTIYLDATGMDTEDILHAIFEELFESPVPIRDLRIERHLSSRRALVAIEDAEIAGADAQRLALAAPRCRLFVTSRQRVLFDGSAVPLEGLAPEYVAALAEQELGRPLSASERAAAEAVGGALRGHPLQLRQMFSRVREKGLSLEALAPRAASASERAADLSPPQRSVARVLAVHGTAPVGLEHIEALAGAAASAAQELATRHDARSYSPRYSLVGTLPEAFDDLDPEIDRALEHFTGWAESEARAGRRDRILKEAAALVELLGRAQRAGRHDAVVRLGIVIEWALAWGNRWTMWGTALDAVLASARTSENAWAEGWAMHQIATRQYGLGNAPAAVSGLQRALELRERIGDDAGAEATRQNLRVAGGPPPLLARLSHLSLAVLAIVAALLIGAAGVSGATILGGGGSGGDDDDAGPALILSVTGKGAVVSGGGSIRCAKAECREELDAGTRVLLRPEPQPGWQFSRWRGGCKGRGACRVLVEEDTRVSALFTRVADPRDVIVRVDGSGTVVSYPAGITCGAKDTECRATFKRSGQVKLTAAAEPGHRFAGWSGGCRGTARCDIAGAERRVAVGARFVADDDARTLTVVIRGDGNGRVVSRQSGIDCGEVCSASFARDTRVVLTAIPQEGSSFPGWSDPACATTGDTCTIRLARSREVAVRFEDEGAPQPGQSHELRVTVRGGGTVTSDPSGLESCDGVCVESLPEGEVTLTAQPAAGYRVSRWGQACAGTEGETCTLTLDKPLSALATFARLPDPDPPPPPTTTTTTTAAPTTYTLTTAVMGAGTIEPDCANGCTYPAGEQLIVSALSAYMSGSYFDRWVTGCPANPQNPNCTITMNSDRRMVAAFTMGSL